MTMIKLPFLLPLLLLLRHTSAEIMTLKISSDSRPLILFQGFGFTRTGEVNISVSSVSVISDPFSDPSLIGFFLLSDEGLAQVLFELQRIPMFCILDSKHINLLLTIRDLSPPPNSSFNHLYQIASPGYYSLFFANCASDTKVSMDVRAELYNLDRNGKVKNFLSEELTHLPLLYFSFSILYFAIFAFWVFVCSKNKKSCHRIHALMGLLVITKALNLTCAGLEKHYVKATGTPHGWNLLFYIFQFHTTLLMFAVIVLIGAGWSFLKPFLQVKEKIVLITVILLQVLANVASVVIGETGPFYKDWVGWNQVFLLVDTLCCCAIMFPVSCSIRSLRATSKTGGKAARNPEKLAVLRQFFVTVICYVLFTRIGIFVLRATVSYKYNLVGNAAKEMADLGFCAVILYVFRARENDEYFVLHVEEDVLHVEEDDAAKLAPGNETD